ncbi:MAG: hypothetical protein IJP85_05710 [Synergistaceae bacterium]|nr:hypothetical protein [Synergistaceae bacterium]
MSNFTKGKWVYDEPFGVIFSYETCAVIANVQGAGTGSCFCSTQEGQANARLIAAAPEMYELMKVWVQVQAQPTLRNAQDKARELLERIDGNTLKGGE